MSYLGILGLEFEKKLSNLKSATSNLSNRKISRKPPPKKCINLRPKMPYLGSFELEIF